MVLHGGLHARLQHLDGVGLPVESAQRGGDDAALLEHRRRRQRAQVAQIGLDAGEPRVGQRRLQLRDRLGAVAAGDDQLGDHRVVVRRDLAAGGDPGLDACVGGEHDLGQRAGAGLELARRVFGIEPHLDGRTVRRRRGDREVVAAREPHHPFDEVDAGHLLGHAVLHLQARVDLEEAERPAVRIEHELHGARRAVADCASEAHGGLQQGLARGGGKARGRRLLDHLLVAPLRRAIAFAQRHHLAATVAEQLHLDVPRMLDELLEVEARVLEVGACQPLHGLVGRRKFRLAADQPHADAAAAGRALEHHRIADAQRLAARFVQAAEQRAAGQQGHRVLPRQLARRVLETEGTHLRRRRPDEGDAGRLAGLGEARVLRQEAVARVDRAGAGVARRLQDALRVEVALRGRRRADAHRGIGHRHMRRIGIRLGVDGHRAQLERLQRADDAAGDGAAVGDQDSVEHEASPRGRSSGRGSKGAAGRPAARVPQFTATCPTPAAGWASGCTRCRGCSAAGSWRSAPPRPSRRAARHTCPAPRCRRRTATARPA